MKKNIISCMAIMVAALASACGDYQVNHECEIGDVKSENDSVIYRCVGIKDKYSYWEKEICQYGILEDKDKMESIRYVCKECDPKDENANICEIKGGMARFSVCDDNGIWKSSLCVRSECSTDGRKCGCKDCVKGCDGNDDGACIKVEGCKQNNLDTGACICIDGVENNPDGTCKCDKDKCVAGCESDGSCKLVEGCDQHDQNGACICAHGTKKDGSCDDSFCVKGTFNSKDGSCTCPSDCAAGCFENGLCKIIGNCSNDANCNEYGYCSGNLCYCKEGKCLLNDINGNHIHDRYESNLVNEPCDSDKVCNVASGEFCDSAMGYKCSVKCSEKTCVDGFVCRSDGRCASEYFTTVWDKKIRGKKDFSFHVEKCNGVEVCWDWKDGKECEWEKIPGEINPSCSEEIKHDYVSAGDSDDTDVTIKIKGELNGVNFYNDSETKGNCAVGCKLLEVRSFGQVGFDSWYDEDNKVNRGVFEQCYMLKKLSDVDIPDSKKLTSMSRMFLDACSFNSPIEQWDVSNVENMKKLFWMPNCTPDVEKSCFKMYPAFNQPLNRWNVSKVTDMNNMFQFLPSFNQPLDKWDVSKVTDMKGMFANMPSFNYPIVNWDVSKVKDMSYMFYSAYSFNQDLSGWDVSKVTNMQSMFQRATSFDQDLSGWNPEGIKNGDNVLMMLEQSGMALSFGGSNDNERKNGNICKVYSSNNWSKLCGNNPWASLFYYNNNIAPCSNGCK